MSLHSIRTSLAEGHWQDEFRPATLVAGLQYARAGRVERVVVADRAADTVRVEAAVRGTQPRPYATSVVLDVEFGVLEIDSDCSCPVGNDCKHAVALLAVIAGWSAGHWQAAATGSAEPAPDAAALALREWERWLASLERERARAVQQTPPAEPDRQFMLLLRAAPGQVEELQVAPVWARPARNRPEAWVDPKSLEAGAEGPRPAPADGWPDGIAEALTLLHGEPAFGSTGAVRWYRLRRAVSERALQALLAHYPARLEKPSGPPLAPGGQRRLVLCWQAEADGTQRLAPVLEPAGGRPLLANGIWYLDEAQGCIGRVDGDPTLLQATATAPRLQPEQVEPLRQRLGNGVLPQPAPALPVRVVATAPQPLLQLDQYTLPTLRYGNRRIDAGRVGSARLWFRYDSLLVAAESGEPRVRQRIGQEIVELQRDLAAERRWIARLDEFSLITVQDLFHAGGDYRSAGDIAHLLLQPQRSKPPLPAIEWAATIDRLRDAGFLIEYGDDFPRQRRVEAGEWLAEVDEQQDGDGHPWFNLSLGIDIGGERVDLLPILRRLLETPEFPLHAPRGEKADATWEVQIDATRSVLLPLSRLRALLAPLLEWVQAEPGSTMRLHRQHAGLLGGLPVQWRGNPALRERLQTLRETRPPAVDAPPGFLATLRPYQREGLGWLDFLGAAGLGGVLADDMGLGKTVQVLAHLLAEKQGGRLEQPALVVCPTSLVGNWRDEAARFAPDLRVLVVHGSNRAGSFDEIASSDLVITTYPLLPRDRDRLLQQTFALLILDEAQAVKNARSQAARVVREIPARRRLAMTGTPLENHLGELWAQIDAVEPGLLGDERQFNRLYRTPIEKHGDADRRQRLNRRIGALLLRRRKQDVLQDLPPKTEILRRIELEDDQRALYESLRLSQHERVRQAVAERGLAQSGIVVLDALLKLRQACCDPALVKLPSARKVKTSAKREALHELLANLLDEGRRVLLFSQFTEMLDLLQQDLQARGIEHAVLTGDTPGRSRAGLVRSFQAGNVPLFLISLKAGGVGLNLTAADTVIHYDPWWNPAVEAQATDRAHRIGQHKPVFVYKLICAGTVEEKINALQSRKAALAESVLGDGSTERVRFDEADLEALFEPLG